MVAVDSIPNEWHAFSERMDPSSDIGPFSWDDLKILLAIARCGSLNAAATDLKTSQSTVSRRLAALEADLGVRLFERTSDGVKPTEVALELIPEARRMEETATSVSTMLRNRDKRCVGRVRVALEDALAIHLVMPSVPRLLEENPGLELELLPSVAMVDLTRHEADLALRFAKPTRGDLHARRVATIGFGVFGREPNALPFDECRWVGWDASHAHLPDAEWLSRTYPAALIGLRVSNMVSLVNAVANGAGIGLLPIALGTRLDLCLLASPSDAPAMPLWLVGHVAHRKVARIRRVSEFLQDVCAKLP
jgi:DNA-binding transcriptional LysR family regulator